jgi:hypothetical protein
MAVTSRPWRLFIDGRRIGGCGSQADIGPIGPDRAMAMAADGVVSRWCALVPGLVLHHEDARGSNPGQGGGNFLLRQRQSAELWLFWRITGRHLAPNGKT